MGVWLYHQGSKDYFLAENSWTFSLFSSKFTLKAYIGPTNKKIKVTIWCAYCTHSLCETTFKANFWVPRFDFFAFSPLGALENVTSELRKT